MSAADVADCFRCSRWRVRILTNAQRPLNRFSVLRPRDIVNKGYAKLRPNSRPRVASAANQPAAVTKASRIIPAHRMKKRREHVIPFSAQAVALVKEIRVRSDDPIYLFPNQRRGKHPMMSENTMLNLVDELGYSDKTTVHGLRSTGSTILHESGKFRSLAIERQLAHVDRNSVRGTYNKAQYLPERREMMQWWADYLDEIAAKKP